MNKNKVLVFLDVSIDGDPFERMIFELFTHVAPKTAENFRALCTGENGVSLKTGKPLHYKGTFFHRIIKGHVAEINAKWQETFFGKMGTMEKVYTLGSFQNETPKLRHDARGLLSMAINDRDERGSLFVVTFKADHRLDCSKRVVFGKLVDGYEVLKKIENAGDDEGIPAVMVKIVNSGEIDDDKKRATKLKMGKDATEEINHELKRKRKHKKSSKKRRKRRRYYTSESDSSTDTDIDSSESDADSDSYTSSLSDTSSSSEDRRKKRKRYKRGIIKYRREKDRRHEKRRRRQKKSKRKSKSGGLPAAVTCFEGSVSDSESDGKAGSSSQDDVAVGASDVKHKPSSNQSPLVERENDKVGHKKGEAVDMSEKEEGEFARGNAEHQNNNVGMGMDFDRSADRHPDIVDDLPTKSRRASLSPIRTKSKSMSISPRTDVRSPDVAAEQRRSRSPSVSRSPLPISRSRTNTPARSESSKSPIRSERERSVSMSPTRRPHSRRSRSRSATFSPPRRTPPRTASKRSSISRGSGKPSRRTVSRSPIRLPRRSISRSSGRAPPRRRSRSPSPAEARRRGYRPSYSGSPVSADRRVKSPVSDHGRSSSRSPSVGGSPKRIRRGRGFSDRYGYVRHYRSRSRSPDRSPVRSYRYGGRFDRDRYSSYRRSPRRYRSPPRGRTPPRYRGRRSPSLSRSPTRYRGGRRYSRSRSRSLVRSRSPVDRYRGSPPRAGRGILPSPSRSRTESVSPRGSQSPRASLKGRSRSSSASPPTPRNLVPYGGD
ncbi:hypothetical protein OROHE_009307 [Orobanche hederae]